MLNLRDYVDLKKSPFERKYVWYFLSEAYLFFIILIYRCKRIYMYFWNSVWKLSNNAENTGHT